MITDILEPYKERFTPEQYERYLFLCECDHGKEFKPCDPESLKTVAMFFDRIPMLRALSAIFLTRDGNFQIHVDNIDWETYKFETVEIEFFPEHIEYFNHVTMEEGCISLDQIDILIEYLRDSYYFE